MAMGRQIAGQKHWRAPSRNVSATETEHRAAARCARRDQTTDYTESPITDYTDRFTATAGPEACRVSFFFQTVVSVRDCRSVPDPVVSSHLPTKASGYTTRRKERRVL